MKIKQLAGMLRLSLLLLSVLGLTNSQAIIIRHDIGPVQYEVRASAYPAVFFLGQQGVRKTCAATIIHKQWALTAAHCLDQTLLGETVLQGLNYDVLVAGRRREIDAVVVHPEFNSSAISDVDLALLRFRQSLDFPVPIPLQREDLSVGEILSILGWGYFGLGTTGRQYSDGRLRLAMNQISEIDRRLRITFDDPREAAHLALPLEGMPGLGDSGGPALLSKGTGFVLAGIAVGELEGDDFSEETQGRYGAVAVYERVSQHIDWIETVIEGSAVSCKDHCDQL